ncbi:pilus assembly protein N-terminal domain-containing protein [Lutibaculum baratangense]|uniref:Secretin RcpA/CpaC, associated with Flp pilus assembly n=1 Tax=Lutibaculum baratangense AMV1 TaxID=631454 RepID=V4QYJ8_9HYPH|nr:pilus assembly protein N-terminal domain-containing protein [Lutibaculum baratangense]ESR24827.1 Secretin RcpA/CpaC, associated with Flp pilus assembly [Lutibaculum baratangense AMV1]
MIARFGGAAFLAALLALPCAAAAETVTLGLDEAEVLRLDQPANTIIVGNPAIADALVQSPQLLVVTGKSYGATNLIVLDAAGEKVGEYALQVGAEARTTVTVQRGPSRYSYSCTPNCNGMLTPGTQKDDFDTLQQQFEGRIGLSRGQMAQ